MLIQNHGNLKLVEWVWPLWSHDTKIGCLKTELTEQTDYLNSGKIKVTLLIFGWSWSKMAF